MVGFVQVHRTGLEVCEYDVLCDCIVGAHALDTILGFEIRVICTSWLRLMMVLSITVEQYEVE